MLTIALAAALFFCQDPVEDNLQRLSDKDPTVREAATVELTKTPLDKLERIEKRLKDPDADVAARARRVISFVLKSTIDLRRTRFELRAVAPPEVMKKWVGAGADPKTPPAGYHLVRYADKAVKPAGYEQAWVPVEEACITSDDVANAVAELDIQAIRARSWNVNFTMTDAGAKAFDVVAEELFKREPKGLLAIVFDEKIISAPIVNAPKFGGKVVFQAGSSEEEAREIAAILRTDRASSFIRLEKAREPAATPEKTVEAVRAIKGLERVSLKNSEAGLQIAGFLAADDIDVILLWQTLRDLGYRLAPKK